MFELVKVWTDIGGPKPVAILARITEKIDSVYKIQYFSPTEDRDHGRVVYRYEDDVYDIDDDSITEYLDSMNESDIGYIQVSDNGWVRDTSDSDDDYLPSEEEDDPESDEESYEDEAEDFVDD
jgi:hypothetical protein